MKRLLLVGACGDVGLGIVKVAVQQGWQLVAAGRSEEKLTRLKEQYAEISTVVADISTEKGSEQLWSDAVECFGGIDAVVVSVNAPLVEQTLLTCTEEDLHAVFHSNVISHFIAAKTFIPKLKSDGIFIGIGGGMADFIAPKLAPVSMAQAALRVMYRALAKEIGKASPHIRELMILSMVNGESRRDIAKPFWITDEDIGRHICAIMDEPERFSGAILKLQNREQVGQSAT